MTNSAAYQVSSLPGWCSVSSVPLCDPDGTTYPDGDLSHLKSLCFQKWLLTGMDNLDVASPTFSCKFYVEANEELHEELLDEEEKPRCKEAVKHFLTAGVFDGLSGTTYDGKIVTDGSDDKSAWKTAGHKCLQGCVAGQIKWDKNYAWTFWYMRTTKKYDRQQPKVMPVFSVRSPTWNRGPPQAWLVGWLPLLHHLGRFDDVLRLHRQVGVPLANW